MMRSLAVKIALIFVLVSLVGVIVTAVLAGRVVNRNASQFVSSVNQELIIANLAERYAQRGGWNGVGGERDGRPGPRQNFTVIDNDGNVVVRAPGRPSDRPVSSAELRRAQPITVDGTVVGQFIPEPDREPPPGELAFLRTVNRTLGLAAVIAVAASLVVGIGMTRTLVRPLQELTQATRAVAAGDLAQTVPVRSDDEIGELAAAFNQMNADLARARDQRRQMTADIAHDLRTPLTVILGHAEALADGVLPATPETLAIIHDESRRLQRLIDDLRTLSLAETGELPLHPQPEPPRALLERAVAAHRPAADQRGVTLTLDAPDGLPSVNVDADRMAQVLDNLLSNALRFTPGGGSVRLSARREGDGVVLRVADSGPGIAPDEVARVFDRFYRSDKARNRAEGGSGLGLAIARSLVEAHGGQISVESGAGATFVIRLPTA